MRTLHLIAAAGTSGLGHESHRNEIKRIRLTNILSLIASAYLVIRAILNLMFNEYTYSVLQLAASFLFAGIILLNRWRAFILARHALILFTNLLVFLFSYFYFGGTIAGGQILYVVFIMFPLVLFDLNQKKDIGIGVALCIFFVSLLFVLENIYPRPIMFSKAGVEVTRISVSILSMVCAFLVTYFFYRLNVESEKEILRAHEALKESRKLLEKEGNSLRVKNDQITADLQVARKIQSRFLPDLPQDKEIAWFYQPMQELGGDFIKFIRLKREGDKPENKLFIFLSDVSGHGVSSAFITVMINSFLEKMPVFEMKSDQLLEGIENEIFPFSYGSFITAFTGIIDFNTCQMTFANAGHPSPAVIHEGESYYLPDESRGVPLCVKPGMNTSQLKLPREEKIRLKNDSLLFFYTDGLLETVPARSNGVDQEDFETAVLGNIFREVGKFSPFQGVKYVIKCLQEFRGVEDYEDDICFGIIRLPAENRVNL